ncbi:MAG: hypothetical protein FJW92_01155 [Actinobacteria bacterium]|nr:hypothetical protein [Actinomycetota bacterium]
MTTRRESRPRWPQPPITTEQLEQIRVLARAYVRECSDDPPLTVGEQGVALALAGAMPSRAREDFGESPQAELAWVVACSWFLRNTHPSSSRRMSVPLYAALDRLEMQSPGDWAGIHTDVEALLWEHGVDSDAWRRPGE